MNQDKPLAERIRPNSLEDYIGQPSILHENSMIRRALKTGLLPSFILWGPPGVGKTSLANLISNELDRPFYTLSAIASGVKDVREVIQKAGEKHLFRGKSPILFIDEIHRFNKGQQDSLLGAVERGDITLIGATTENPSFEVIPALLSRCQVFTLDPFGEKELKELIHHAIEKDPWLNALKPKVEEWDALLRLSGGDGRKLLNLFELIVSHFQEEGEVVVTNARVKSISPEKLARYDKTGDQHYDIISAFIKSIRGSDVQASLYWLARMIEGGEDVKFIARRLIISASEDIGLANPTALVMANACFEAVERIGWPESRIILSQTTIYLASSAKSNSAYKAIGEAQSIVKQTRDLPVPNHLKNAPTKLMKDLGHGKDYKYSHDFPGNFVKQEFLPEDLKKTVVYRPAENDRERQIHRYLSSLWGDSYFS